MRMHDILDLSRTVVAAFSSDYFGIFACSAVAGIVAMLTAGRKT